MGTYEPPHHPHGCSSGFTRLLAQSNSHHCGQRPIDGILEVHDTRIVGNKKSGCNPKIQSRRLECMVVARLEFVRIIVYAVSSLVKISRLVEKRQEKNPGSPYVMNAFFLHNTASSYFIRAARIPFHLKLFQENYPDTIWSIAQKTLVCFPSSSNKNLEGNIQNSSPSSSRPRTSNASLASFAAYKYHLLASATAWVSCYHIGCRLADRDRRGAQTICAG
jgi:hypothetical protein